MAHNYAQLLQVAIEAAQKGSQIAKKYYGTDQLNTQQKSDNTPVTQADKEAEQIIKSHLKSEFPDHHLLGEESGDNGQTSEYTWLIDPIDGTRFYARAMPMFGVLIGLAHQNEFVLGVSVLPAFDELIYASKGQGAFVRKPDGPDHQLQVSQTSDLSQAAVNHSDLGSMHQRHKLDHLCQMGQQVRESRCVGNTMANHALAKGQFDANVETLGRVWDFAAHSVIITEAGGMATQIDGQPFTLESTDCLFSNGHLHSTLLDIFSTK